jgi:hypothetical protein
MTATNDRLLRRTLWANAGLSVASGAALALFAGPLARLAAPAPVHLLGLDLAALLALLGIGFVAFGGLCGWVASREVLPLAWGRAIFVLDAGWVAISAVLLALPGVWSTAGIVGIAGMALVVADLAILEYLGLRRLAGPALRPAH